MSLESIADRYWKTLAEFSPTVATVRGVHDFDDQLRGFDDESLDVMASRFRALADEATALDTTGLATAGRAGLQGMRVCRGMVSLALTVSGPVHTFRSTFRIALAL